MSDPPDRQFPYSVPDGALDELDSLPRLPLTLHYREQHVGAIGEGKRGQILMAFS